MRPGDSAALERILDDDLPPLRESVSYRTLELYRDGDARDEDQPVMVLAPWPGTSIRRLVARLDAAEFDDIDDLAAALDDHVDEPSANHSTTKTPT